MNSNTNTPETIADICREMREQAQTWWDRKVPNFCDLHDTWAITADHLISAYEREMAAKDAEIARLKEKSCEYALPNHGCTAEAKHFHKTVELERKVALLERALKPVMECNPNMQYSDYHCTIAVREAQRIIKEGGEK